MEKIITVRGKNYNVVPDSGKECDCTGCYFNTKGREDECYIASELGRCGSNHKVFQEVIETNLQTKPTIQMNLELDLSNCILPVFFTVKTLRLQSLDTALKNQCDAYNVSVKDLPQETLEVVAEALKAEFIRRNTKVQV